MSTLQRMGGAAAVAEAVIYVAIFVVYGAVLQFPATASVAEKLAFIAQNKSILFAANLIGYVLFGILLAVLVLALHERLRGKAATLGQLAGIFGVIWVGLVMASGMIANIGLATVIKVAAEEPEQARAVWLTINSVVEGLGGGNEVVGGVWVLLISCAALKASALPRSLNYFGLLVGLAGVFTIYPAEVMTEIFGLSQIVWFFWLGVVLLRTRQRVANGMAPA